jgi:colanic acid/amylovoran biosynthesis glycosyltransferase
LFQPLSPPAFNDVPIILCVARHVVVKNLGLLLRAFALLVQWKIAFRGVLIGDGPCHDDLKRLARDLGMNDHVEFVGAATQDDILPRLQRADVAVLSSSNEGMPVSLMEAAACGVPVVATAVGGIPELVRDGVTGLLAPPEPEPYANMLRRLLDNRSVARTMGAAARADAVKRFSVKRQGDDLISLWTGLHAWPK